ncbi:hypothetical protein [Actinomadura livida]|uniref:Uncharacterized protein n=1 Tax=Actinomadura livida TaxID=79909 RepID=A0A7W7N1B7_9ACTN|nr:MULTISPECIES: hypothetical protein [Actinomadura]MBB4778881.1 hypothetical protein [Actinomadura catellatispora]
MKHLQRVHGLVRHAVGRRKPVPHGPAFRLTALVTGLAVATTTLAVTAPAASAAGKSPPHRPASAAKTTLARAAALMTFRRPASAARASDQAFRTSGRQRTRARPPLMPALTGPSPGPRVTTTAPPDVPPQNNTSQDGKPAEATTSGTVEPGTLPEGIPESRRVDHRFAEVVLRANGIRRRSTGGCSDRMIRTCTSFEQIRWGTIKGLVRFARSSGCDIVVTGGTERGHAGGPYSHWNGYKADISPNRCVDDAVERHPFAGVRGDGARLYRSPDGALFARESDHWDITFR